MKDIMAQKSNKHPGIRPGNKPSTYRIEYYDWDRTRRTKIFRGSHSDAVKLRRSLLAKVDQIKNGLEPPPGQIRSPVKLSELWDQFHSDYQIKVKSGSIVQSSLNRYINSINALYGYDSLLERKLASQIN